MKRRAMRYPHKGTARRWNVEPRGGVALDKKPTGKQPSTLEIREAQRAARGMLRKEFLRLDHEHDDILADAIGKALKSWRGDAKFSTYVHGLARHEAVHVAKRLDRTVPQIEAETGGRVRPKPSGKLGAAFGRACERFIRNKAACVETMMFRERAKLVEYLGYSLSQPHGIFAWYLADERLPLQPVALHPDFARRLHRHIERVCKTCEAGWIESAETKTTPIRSPGRPRGPLSWHERRTAVAEGIVRYAMKLAGISGTAINHARRAARAAVGRAEARRFKRAVEALERAMAEDAKTEDAKHS